MPASPLTRTRASNELKWLFPSKRFTLKEIATGQCAVWLDNEPKATFVGQAWEDVMKQAVKEAWKE